VYSARKKGRKKKKKKERRHSGRKRRAELAIASIAVLYILRGSNSRGRKGRRKKVLERGVEGEGGKGRLDALSLSRKRTQKGKERKGGGGKKEEEKGGRNPASPDACWAACGERKRKKIWGKRERLARELYSPCELPHREGRGGKRTTKRRRKPGVVNSWFVFIYLAFPPRGGKGRKEKKALQGKKKKGKGKGKEKGGDLRRGGGEKKRKGMGRSASASPSIITY